MKLEERRTLKKEVTIKGITILSLNAIYRKTSI